jgi:hypothetical protein
MKGEAMSKRLLATITALATCILAAGAVPAFPADSGTVAVSVTAQAPPAPCLTVTPGTVDFGTLPFSRTPNYSIGSRDVTVNNRPCLTINLNGFILELLKSGGILPLSMTGTPAPVLAWPSGTPEVFPSGDQIFRLRIFMPCQGSNGAGETKTLTATFTAVVP